MQGLVDSEDAIGYFMGINNARFRGEVAAGKGIAVRSVTAARRGGRNSG